MACKELSECYARFIRKNSRRNTPLLKRHLTETILRTDSGIYRLRCGHLTRLTTDHTFIHDLAFEGGIAPEREEYTVPAWLKSHRKAVSLLPGW